MASSALTIDVSTESHAADMFCGPHRRDRRSARIAILAGMQLGTKRISFVSLFSQDSADVTWMWKDVGYGKTASCVKREA
jgi:hypothetical protein